MEANERKEGEKKNTSYMVWFAPDMNIYLQGIIIRILFPSISPDIRAQNETKLAA